MNSVTAKLLSLTGKTDFSSFLDLPNIDRVWELTLCE